MLPTCSACLFGGVAGAPPAASYAFVLCHGGASVAAEWEREAGCRAEPALAGVSAYCAACRSITWLATSADPLEALLHMQARKRRWGALYAALA